MRMNFGKYEGVEVEDVPTAYLEWAYRECRNMEPQLRRAVREELRKREEETAGGPRFYPPTHFTGIINRWHRELVVRWHPDRGGDTKVMQALNDAVDRLRQMVRAG